MTKCRSLFVWIALSTCLVTSSGWAYRPLVTEDAAVGALLEEGVELSWEMTDEPGDLYAHTMIGAFVFGLGRAELMIEAPYAFNGPNQGVNGVLIGGKILMLGADEEGGLLTTKVEYTAPEENIGLSIISSKGIGPVWLHAQVGWSNDFSDNGVFGGISFDWMPLEWLSVVGEVVISHTPTETPMNGLAGVIFKPADWLAIDVAGTKSITSYAPMFTILAGLTFIFPQPETYIKKNQKPAAPLQKG